MKNFDVVIVGAGIVGLSSALKILQKNRSLKVAIIEKESAIAQHQTGNNSGVIHSGIYYKPGSLKAINCKNGYQQLLQFAQQHSISHDICGKIIVATKLEELPYLDTIYQRGVENGLVGIKKITQQEIVEKEPHCSGIAGIWVPQAGIIDYKQVSKKYLELAQALGAELFLNERVENVVEDSNHIKVLTNANIYSTKLMVNCAGLYSDKVASFNQKVGIKIIPFRGEYYTLIPEKHYLVKNLIYPVPNPNFPFLGVHFTRMIQGGVEAGPNAVLAFGREAYKKSDLHIPELLETLTYPGFLKVAKKYWREGWDEMYRSFSKRAFTKALQALVPEIQSNHLSPGGAGIRAQACDVQGNLLDDFYFVEEKFAVHVCNAPSPAATSSLSIGDTISEKVLARF